jgi:hypothetical protein
MVLPIPRASLAYIKTGTDFSFLTPRPSFDINLPLGLDRSFGEFRFVYMWSCPFLIFRRSLWFSSFIKTMCLGLNSLPLLAPVTSVAWYRQMSQ